jgi:hypothetical protein
LASVDAAAITLQPRDFASCTLAMPTPPAAPSTSTVSPPVTRPRSKSAWCAVAYVSKRPLPCSNDIASGMRAHWNGVTASFCAKPPTPVNAITRSPSASSVTPGPTSLTTPAISPPGENGSGGLIW